MDDRLKPEDFILNQSFCDFVTGTDSNAVIFWNYWLAQHPENKADFDKAVSLLKMLLNARKLPVTTNKHQSLQTLLKNLEYNAESQRTFTISFKQLVWIRVAAAAILLIGIAAVVWMLQQNTVSGDVSLFTEIFAPIGEKAQITLPDNSHVWINSGSRLRYPLKYGKDKREVFLEGEAYFDVTKQDGKLFIVQTKDVKIKVLGTAFNVKSYGVDKTVETTVVRGRVQVESASAQNYSVFVNPNEKAVFVKDTRQIAVTSSAAGSPKVEKSVRPIFISRVNPEPVVSWKDQHLVFTDEMLEDMVVKMERWYNIKIEISDTSLLTERYNGKFVHNETIYQVLEVVKLTTPITYAVENNIIIISRK